MKIFLLATSLSSNSINKKLIEFSAKLLHNQGHEVEVGDFSDFNVPFYNIDIQQKEGIPENIHKFIAKMENSDCTIFSSPEYNYSISGVFKNLIDWTSRASPNPWKGKKIFLMSASPSSVGGIRGLWATRIPLEGLGAYVFPGMFSLAESYKNLDNNGQIIDPNLVNQLNVMNEEFLKFASKL
jgi:NAD(P)H-dependent FMN reductase